MPWANLMVLAVSGMLLGMAVRNLLGRPAKLGIVTGWISMIGFAALAAWCFWMARQFRTSAATAAAMAVAQKFMILYLIGLLLAAAGVTRQRKLLRKPPPPPAPPVS
jgi:Na+/glutamate symporter